MPVMIASAAAKVRSTQSPCNVQVMKNRSGSVLMRSKRPSRPSRRTRRNRKEPSRRAHTPYHCRHDHRPGIDVVAEEQGDSSDCEIGDAAGQVEVVLGLRAVGGYEHHPVDGVGEQAAYCEHSDGADLRTAVASGEHDERTNQQAGGDSEERVPVLVCHCGNPRPGVAEPGVSPVVARFSAASTIPGAVCSKMTRWNG